MLVGLTALSLDMSTKFETFFITDAFVIARVLKTLFLIPSQMLFSTRVTCL